MATLATSSQRLEAACAAFTGPVRLSEPFPGSPPLWIEPQGDALVAFTAPQLARQILPRSAGMPREGAMELAFRPHAAHLFTPAQAAQDSGLSLPGTVATREFLGESMRYSVQTAAGAFTVDRPHLAGEMEFAPGAAVILGVAAEHLRVLRD